MDEIISQIKNQTEINFINLKDQIEVAELAAVYDGVSASRYIFHNLHSIDRFFINPNDYVYEGERLFGIAEKLSVIDAERAGYVDDPSIVIAREKLLAYFDFVKDKIEKYFKGLTSEALLQKPEPRTFSAFDFK